MDWPEIEAQPPRWEAVE